MLILGLFLLYQRIVSEDRRFFDVSNNLNIDFTRFSLRDRNYFVVFIHKYAHHNKIKMLDRAVVVIRKEDIPRN